MPLRVDILYTTAKGQECRPLFELRDGVVRALDPFAEELARDGIKEKFGQCPYLGGK